MFALFHLLPYDRCMSAIGRNRAVLPPHLQLESFRTLPPEDPRVVTQDMICINPDTHEVYVYGNEVLEPEAKTRKIKKGRVAIMRTFIDTQRSGFVADLRYVRDPSLFDETAPDDPPDDQEAFNGWQELKKHEIPVRAITFYEEDGKTVGMLGDEAFYEAAITLTRIVDGAKADTSEASQEKPHESKSDVAQKVTLRDRMTALIFRPM